MVTNISSPAVTISGISYLDLATAANFDEQGYLQANPDVAAAIVAGSISSGRSHFETVGLHEHRKQASLDMIATAKQAKIARIRTHIDSSVTNKDHVCGAIDCMTDNMRATSGVFETNAVSSNEYDEVISKFIVENPDKFILDAGAGFRPIYYQNVVNFEIAPYPTTDVIGVGETLPFFDDTFDFVISSAVLEHVRDPFKCACELYRVLKPGGEMFIAAPFLAPYHGYPDHYYNMTQAGLRHLFPESIDVIDHYVPHYFKPLWVAQSFFRIWTDGLHGQAKHDFLNMRVSDFLAASVTDYQRPFVAELDDFNTSTLAFGTVLRAKKPLR